METEREREKRDRGESEMERERRREKRDRGESVKWRKGEGEEGQGLVS